MTAFNEYSALREVGLRHPKDAFRNQETVCRQWKGLNFLAEPDFSAAMREHDAFVRLLQDSGCEIEFLPAHDDLTLDAIFVRDATLMSPKGFIPCAMGKTAREAEPAIAQSYLQGAGKTCVPRAPEPGAKVEGGDFVWFDERTCAVGEGYRTNRAGIDWLKKEFGPETEVVAVPLPHYNGRDDVFHLMSFLSPIDADLALVFSRLMPVPFRSWLLDRGMTLIEVPDEEFDSLGCNVLSTGPRQCIMPGGNPGTKSRLEAAGCDVSVYSGREISLKGGGGPTCLTRPLLRV